MSNPELMEYRAQQEGNGVEWTSELENFYVDLSQQTKIQIRKWVESAIKEHPQFKALLREAAERQPQLANVPNDKLGELVQQAIRHPPLASLVNNLIDRVVNRLEGDPQDTKDLSGQIPSRS